MDFDKLMKEELNKSRERNMFRPSGPSVMNTHLSVDDGTLLETGKAPQELMSLFNLVLDSLDEKGLADAEDDAKAIHHLNQLNSHRGG